MCSLFLLQLKQFCEKLHKSSNLKLLRKNEEFLAE